MRIGVEDPPSGVEDWAGASGSPVFVDGALVAVIRDAPIAFAGGRIDAIALERVLDKEPELRALLAEPRSTNRVKRTEAKIRGLVDFIAQGDRSEYAVSTFVLAADAGPCIAMWVVRPTPTRPAGRPQARRFSSSAPARRRRHRRRERHQQRAGRRQRRRRRDRHRRSPTRSAPSSTPVRWLTLGQTPARG